MRQESSLRSRSTLHCSSAGLRVGLYPASLVATEIHNPKKLNV
jgi:hypothetical protein